MAKKRYCHWKLKLLDHQEILLKENRHSAKGQKYRVHIKCMEESTEKVTCVKKLKGLNILLKNTL